MIRGKKREIGKTDNKRVPESSGAECAALFRFGQWSAKCFGISTTRSLKVMLSTFHPETMWLIISSGYT